jgi:hypothetical protein
MEDILLAEEDMDTGIIPLEYVTVIHIMYKVNGHTIATFLEILIQHVMGLHIHNLMVVV